MATALEDIPHIYLQQTDDCSRLGEVLKIRFFLQKHVYTEKKICAFQRLNA